MWLVLLILVLAASGAQGAEWGEKGHDVTGRLGVRLAAEDTPVGLRYFWDRRYGADGSVGFSFGGDSDTIFNLEGAFLYALAPGERANLHLRPAIGFQSADNESSTRTTIIFSLGTEVEFFATQDLSVSAGAGVNLASVSGGRGDADGFSTYRDMFARASFQYYFPDD